LIGVVQQLDLPSSQELLASSWAVQTLGVTLKDNRTTDY
jgi:hypothetical protein